jgi:hypothetical protein
MRQQLDNLYARLRSFSRVALVGLLLMAGLYYLGVVGNLLVVFSTIILVGSVLASWLVALLRLLTPEE